MPIKVTTEEFIKRAKKYTVTSMIIQKLNIKDVRAKSV